MKIRATTKAGKTASAVITIVILIAVGVMFIYGLRESSVKVSANAI